MKLKLTISFLIWVFIIGSYLHKNRETIQTPSVNSTGHIENKLTKEEQEIRLEYLLTGKSEKFEAETDFAENETGTVIKDTSEFGNGVYVMYCSASSDRAGYMLKGIKKRSHRYSIKNGWMNDTAHDWYIVPRIRIKQNLIYPFVYEDYIVNAHLKVCRLEIVNAEGRVIRETEYQVKHFSEKFPGDECKIYYTGSYMEGYGFMFDYPPGNKTITIVNGKNLNPKGLENTKNTKLDYRIYWYGNVDMWIDYIRVENDLAVELPEGKYDIWIQAMKDVDLTGLSIITASPDQALCYGYLRNKAYSLGFAFK